MAKVFTITEGLENLGAMKTGGQGSVYKGRRIGEIITAIKLLPTPVYSESADDKNYIDFQNEVQKLKKVNEEPNPHVVTILSSGITDSGNFPFIEMEYIEGPDLEDLLKAPHDPVFTISEIMKVAFQLSDALAHCHKLNVKHGDIKSNNVKFSTRTGNYVLLDFGLSVMSDEQRRTSLRQAGAIEFMAPEQNEGLMLFETDVYSFGIILFELLAGTVPFPLTDKGETARNNVRLAHMATPPPDLLPWRREKMPASWISEKRDLEMQVPGWMISLVYKCLEKKPASRFRNGVELHEYIRLNSSINAIHVNSTWTGDEQSVMASRQAEQLMHENHRLQQELQVAKQQAEAGNNEIKELKSIIIYKENELQQFRNGSGTAAGASQPQKGIPKALTFILLLFAIAASTYALYNWINRDKPNRQVSGPQDSSTLPLQQEFPENKPEDRPETRYDQPDTTVQETTTLRDPITDTTTLMRTDTTKLDETPEKPKDRPDVHLISAKYKVISKAYFYDRPDENSRREAYILSWNNAVLNASKEQNGFIYVVYTNAVGQTSKGWMNKQDLKLADE